MRRFMPQSRRPNGRLCCSPVKLGRSTLNAFAAMQVSAPAQTLPGLDPYRHALHDRRFSMSYDVMTTCKHPIPFCVRSVTPPIHAQNRQTHSSPRKGTLPHIPILYRLLRQDGRKECVDLRQC